MPESSIPATIAAPAALYPVLTTLVTLIEASRPACQRPGSHARLRALAVGWLLACGRHTLTGVLRALGQVDGDWTASYRLLSTPRGRFRPSGGTPGGRDVAVERGRPELYLVALDATLIPRQSRRMPGTGWFRAPGTAVFARGLCRAQRFVGLSWLPLPNARGYSRALPLRWLAAFSPKGGGRPRPPAAQGMGSWARRPDLAASAPG